jgi:hypothetical protein
MKKWMLYVIMVVLLGSAMRSYGQDSTRVLANHVKVDLLGLYYPLSLYIGGIPARLSVEYERPLLKTKHWSWTADFELGRKGYEFRKFWEWEGYDPPITPGYWYGQTYQKDYSLLIGLRHTCFWGGQAKRFKAFIEPQIGGVLRHARLFNDRGFPTLVTNKIAWNPRLRAGLGWAFHPRWELEGLAGVYHYQRLGDGRSSLRVFPELNLGFRF